MDADLLAPLLSRPWAISARHFSALQAQLSFLAQPRAFFDLADLVSPRPSMSIDDAGHAAIHVQGALADKAPPIWSALGQTDYRDIRREVSRAVSSEARSITLHIDSPGGSVSGLPETAEAIGLASDAGIPVLASCDGLACSAAYWLASAADRIDASPSTEVGNIGVLLIHQDPSKFFESMGIEVNVLTNQGADLKATFRQPLTDTQRQFLQDELDAVGSQFHHHVSSSRPSLDPEVFRAGWYSGQSALEMGLIDNLTIQ